MLALASLLLTVAASVAPHLFGAGDAALIIALPLTLFVLAISLRLRR